MPSKILVDTVRTEIKILEPLKSVAPQSKPMPDSELEALSQPKPDSHVKDIKVQSKQPKPLTKNIPTKPMVPPPMRQVAEKPAESYTTPPFTSPPIPGELGGSEGGLDDMPPPPDNFPDGWDSEWQPSFDDAVVASQPEPKFKKKEEVTPPRVQLETAPVEVNDLDPIQDDAAREAIVTSLKSIYIPLVKEDEKEHPPKQITVNLRSSGNKEEDRRRIKTIYGTLTSFPGRDRFSFQIFENGGRHLLDFPNDSTHINPEMLKRLLKLMGEESWNVEEITFQ
jgi:hypothetical protein